MMNMHAMQKILPLNPEMHPTAMGEKDLLADFYVTETSGTNHFILQEDWEFLQKAYLPR